MNDRDNLFRLSEDEVVLLHVYRRLDDKNKELVLLLAATAAERSRIESPTVVAFLPALRA